MGLTGTLSVPAMVAGTVVFAQCAGQSVPGKPAQTASRNSPLARTLLEAGLATLVFDLLAPCEAPDKDNVLLLADRVDYAIGFVRSRPETAGLPICIFGADSGGSAALVSAGSMPSLVCAVVSLTGRPDIATDMLGHVRAPTLFIVDGGDTRALALNLAAKAMMACQTGLQVLPLGGSLSDGHNSGKQVACLAADWFKRHVGRPGAKGLRPIPTFLTAHSDSNDGPYGRDVFAHAKKA